MILSIHLANLFTMGFFSLELSLYFLFVHSRWQQLLCHAFSWLRKQFHVPGNFFFSLCAALGACSRFHKVWNVLILELCPIFEKSSQLLCDARGCFTHEGGVFNMLNSYSLVKFFFAKCWNCNVYVVNFDSKLEKEFLDWPTLTLLKMNQKYKCNYLCVAWIQSC